MEDPLRVLYLMTFGVMNLKVTKIFSILVLVVHGPITLIQMFDFLTNFDGQLLQQGGPYFFITCSNLACTFVIYYCEKVLSRAFSEFWTSEKVRSTKKILIESKIITIISITTLMILITFSVAILPVFSQTESLFYGVTLYKRKFAKQSSLFYFIYYATFPITAYITFINGGFLVYLVMHAKFRIYAINDHLQKMTFCTNLSDDLIRNKLYQRQIHKQLKICIRRHESVISIIQECNKKLGPYIILLLYLGVGVIVSALFYVIKGRSELIHHKNFDYFSAICGVIASLAIPSLAFYTVQAFKDEQEKIFGNLYSCPWTVWNLNNRKILLIFMANVQEPSILGYSQIFAFENLFLLKLLQFIWSVVTFILQVAQ